MIDALGFIISGLFGLFFSLIALAGILILVLAFIVLPLAIIIRIIRG